MPTYGYKALTQAGKVSSGVVAAPTRAEAIRRLVAVGQNVLELREEKPGAGEPLARDRIGQKRPPDRQGRLALSGRGGPVVAWRRGHGRGLRFWRRRVHLSTFTRQLATLSASGVPLVQSLNVLIEQTRDPRAVQILADIRESVEAGSTLADALAAHPRVFPRTMPSMVRVGEMGGTLDDVLLQLAELYEREDALKGEVRAALAYPVFVLFLGLASAVLLIAFLIPRLRLLFDGIGQALPAPTRLLLGMSGVVTGYGWLLAILAIVLVMAFRAALRSHDVRLFVDRCKLGIPWVGKLIRTVAIARFARLLGTLTRAGISLVEGIEVVHPAVGNEVIAEAVESMSGQIRAGASVASVMKAAGVFPPLPIQMVAVGEETGRLEEMLLRAADVYEREASAATRVMTSLLAPVMILCVAAVVGFIILSMLLPIFQLSSVMG